MTVRRPPRANRSHFSHTTRVQKVYKKRTSYPSPVDWWELQKRVFRRDNNTCRKCGITKAEAETKGRKMQVHHIRRLADGGTNAPTNLMTVCSRCHKRFAGHSHMR